MNGVHVVFPMELPSAPNLSEHWAEKASRVKRQRTQAWVELRAAAPQRVVFVAPITVTLTRIAPRQLDGDNLQGAFKGVRDGVADWLGLDDGSELVKWEYAQRRAKPGEKAVEIRVKGGVVNPFARTYEPQIKPERKRYVPQRGARNGFDKSPISRSDPVEQTRLTQEPALPPKPR